MELQGGKVELAPVAPETVVHKNVKCDGCGKLPLTGIRYKCYECADFDFCEECEAKLEHPHNFIKIKKPIEGCPWKMFKKDNSDGERRHNSGHHGGPHKRGWAVFGCIAKRAFKLSKCFGGDPETFRSFVEKNPEKNFYELKDIYIRENNIKAPKFELNEEKITKRCRKLAFIFREPAENFVELVKKFPEMRAWELVEVKKSEDASKIEEKKEVVEPVKIEASKIEAPKIEEPVKPESKIFVKEITDDDLYASNSSLAKKESIPKPVAEKKEEAKRVSEVKVQPPKFLNKLDEKEPDFQGKQAVLQELIDIIGSDNDYLNFVRKNYKQGVAHCLNAWFEPQN